MDKKGYFRVLGLFVFSLLILSLFFPGELFAENKLLFSDVTSELPYYKGIEYLKNQGMTVGYSDGTFGISKKIARAEIATMIMRGEGEDAQQPAKACFLDVPAGPWFSPFICGGKEKGFWSGYPSGRFEPAWNVSRVEAIQMLCSVQKWPAVMPEKTPFLDAKKTEWYSACTSFAKQNHFIDHLVSNNKLLPIQAITRGEFAQLYFLADTTEIDDALIQGSFVSLKQKMLDLVNEERRNQNLAAVQWSQELSAGAEAHSIDMWKRDFFSHTNPSGEDPDERRLRWGISTGVGENLHFGALTIENAHESLMRSPPHKENILTPDWERLGIGIAKDENGQLYLTQWFSVLPVTETELEAKEIEIITQMNKKRDSLSPLIRDNTLDALAAQWNMKMIEDNFFSMQAPDGTSFKDLVFKAVNMQQLSLKINKMGSGNFDGIDEQVALATPLDSAFKKIGIAFTIEADGDIYLSIIFTD